MVAKGQPHALQLGALGDDQVGEAADQEQIAGERRQDGEPDQRIVAWQWLPFATLILLTSLQSLDGEQKEAAEMDGAGFVSRFWYLTLPHLARAITVVVLIQTIFLLAIYVEIAVTTGGGPGYASTNLPFQISKSIADIRYGLASAGGILAVILANFVA